MVALTKIFLVMKRRRGEPHQTSLQVLVSHRIFCTHLSLLWADTRPKRRREVAAAPHAIDIPVLLLQGLS